MSKAGLIGLLRWVAAEDGRCCEGHRLVARFGFAWQRRGFHRRGDGLIDCAVINFDCVLTDHARRRCARRKIKPEWIAATLESPASTENDADDPTLAHALRAIPEKGFRVLRVIYDETVNPVAVVTAYFDDGARDL